MLVTNQATRDACVDHNHHFVGRNAVLTDPQGAVFVVFTPARNAPGPEGASRIGEFSWHELAMTDYDAPFN